MKDEKGLGTQSGKVAAERPSSSLIPHPSSLLSAAAAHHRSTQDSALRTSLSSFKTLLADKFGIATDPADLTIEAGGVTIRYLNPRELSVRRKCPDCEFTVFTDGLKDLAQLGRELASRPLPGHDCKKHSASSASSAVKRK